MDHVETLTKFVEDVCRAMGRQPFEAGRLVTKIIARTPSLTDLYTADGKLDGLKANAALAAVLAPSTEAGSVTDGPPKPVPIDEFCGMGEAAFMALEPAKRLQLAHCRDYEADKVDAGKRRAQEGAETVAVMPPHIAKASPTIRLAWANDREAERVERERKKSATWPVASKAGVEA